MKRFTATEKWDDSWFRKLPLLEKCFWSFICDRCDAAGVWKVDLEAAEFFLDSKLDGKKLLVTFAGRVRDIGRGRWWITNFIQFQNGPLSEACIPHKKIIIRLREHGLYEEYLSTLQTRVVSTLKEEGGEEEEEEEAVEEERSGGAGGEPVDPANPHKLSPLGLRISGWFSRRPSTQWSDRELRELRKVEAFKTPEDDLLLLEQRYLSGAPFIRKEILTLLNNWNGEIDRCKCQSNGRPESKQIREGLEAPIFKID